MKMFDIYEKSGMLKRVEGGEFSVTAASLFTCGIMLKEIFFTDLSFREVEEYSFEEIWYMICRYHDERMENEERKTMQFNFSPLLHYPDGGIQYTNGIRVQNCMYTKLQMKDYFYFQKICCGEKGMGHGIAGGILLYEYLILNRMQSGKELDKQSLNLYSYAANTMAVHNICRKQESEMLLVFEEDPLLFLLLIAETIEPLQYARCRTNCRELLQEINVQILKEKLIFRINPQYFDIYKLEKKTEQAKRRIKFSCEIVHETSEICIMM